MEQFTAWKAMMVAGEPTTLWQQFYVLFYQAFIENDRWLQYLNGVVTTLYVTVLALVLGILLGIIVAVIRTAHDQQRPGHRNPVLGFFNAILKIYVTVIRGTPMMVQLMIMGLVIFASSRDFVMVGALTLGINSGAYTAEIIRGADGSRAQPGHELHRYDAVCDYSAGDQGDSSGAGQRVHRVAEGYVPDQRHRREGTALRGPQRGLAEL